VFGGRQSTLVPPPVGSKVTPTPKQQQLLVEEARRLAALLPPATAPRLLAWISCPVSLMQPRPSSWAIPSTPSSAWLAPRERSTLAPWNVP
jgi:hypothetical protein